MGINLRDYVHDVDDLFTLEEAERLFEAAGYTKKQELKGFKSLEITREILASNQATAKQQVKNNFDKEQHFEFQIQQKVAAHPEKQGITIEGFEQVYKYHISASTDIGGTA